MKRRKCDGPKRPAFAHAPPPQRTVCPICGLPGDPLEEWKIIQGVHVFFGEPAKKTTCEFFSRVRSLKFHDDPKVSAKLRSDHFRKFHSDFCETCREPETVCRQRKVAKVVARAKKIGSPNGDDWYLEPNEIRELADVEPCKKPNQAGYTPVLPVWYTEAKK